MIEKESEEKTNEEKTLDYAERSGLSNLIEDISKERNLNSFEEKMYIPIPPEVIEDGNLKITIADIKEKIEVMISIINDKESAKEFPFLITGKYENGGETIKLKNMEKLYKDITQLKSKEVEFPSKTLGEEVVKTKENENINVLALCHTHPNIEEHEKEKTIAGKIKHETKEKYNIREAGLNISLQDFYQLVSFEEVVKKNYTKDYKIYTSIIMHNGDMCLIYVDEEKFKKVKISLD